jgi:tetratricopeptide (TPR) repeat protein
LALALLFAALAAGCATTSRPPVPHRDRFPLDPREELAGPFPEEVLKGCAALAEGDARSAESAFGAARSAGRQSLAAEIGWIEAVVMRERSGDAVPVCEKMLEAGEPTLPLLVACGEARASAGDAPSGYELYRRAVAKDPDRYGLNERAEELRLAARDERVARAKKNAGESDWDGARSEIAEAISLAPESSQVRIAAGDIEARAGDKAAALRRYREAMDIEPRNPAVLEKTGSLALELHDYGLAISAFDRLARENPRAEARAAEARLAFRVANWPPAEREAARAQRLTRAAAAGLLWWTLPEVREARVGAGVIASDAVSRRDSRALTRAVALGLLEVDPETHRVSPDAALSAAAASKLLVRLVGIFLPNPGRLPCMGKSARAGSPTNAEAIRMASGCRLLSEKDGPVVSGPAFLRALDRVRTLVSEEPES